jgi:hypothetical protein
MDTIKQFYRVDRRCINMVRFIFEAYEGVAVVTTLDAAAGAIVLAVAPGCETTAQAVMSDLGRHFLVEAGAAAAEYGTDKDRSDGI